MARVRLTSRTRQAADDKTPYPGSINQEGRAEEQRGSNTYRTFEPSVANHELTDTRKVHGVSDQHNEIGFGIPDPASGMLVASSEYQAKCIKAAELAETYLGPKVADRLLLAQARDFLSLSDEALDRTIERFNRTGGLYIAEESEESEEHEESETPEKEAKEEACVAEETQNTSRQVPVMEEGSAASPQVADTGTGGMSAEAAASPATPAAPVAPVAPEVAEETEEKTMISQAKATNLATLAACTLQPENCTQANIVATAKKFASLSNDQIKTLLSGYGKIAAEEGEKEEEGEVEAPEATEETEVQTAGEIEVTTAQSLDIGSFDLSEEFNDGPITATAEEEAELANIFDDEASMYQMPTMPMMDSQALMASIAQMTGKSKVASKVGVKSIGNVTLHNTAPAQGMDDLEGLWDKPML